ncbi:MAG: class I tRNA ligase family protein, partial [Gammaproteobacteria bacterium]
RLATFYPTTVLVTGFDIIFFWVARMVMFGLKFMGKPPFTEVYIHGLVRDADGNKMSKSKGNILDPMDLVDGISLDELIAKRTTGLMQPHLAPRIVADTRRQFPDGIASFGTDALRFTYCSLATQGRDIRFDLGRIEGYRNFCNKLWNAARFVVMNVEGRTLAPAGGDAARLPLAERWVRSRFRQTIEAVDSGFTQYRFDLAAQAIYEFTWNEYCDWYVEIAKSSLRNDGVSESDKAAIRRNLVDMLEAMLRLVHPLMPFISEAIWQQVRPLAEKNGETIMREPYPRSSEYAVDEDALVTVSWLKTFVLAVRKIRGELNVNPGVRLHVLLQNASAGDRARTESLHGALSALSGIASIGYLDDDDAPPQAAFGLIDEMKLLVPLEGLIDKDVERARLTRELEKLDKDLARAESKLENPKFVERAPARVVEQERQRVSDMGAARGKLTAQLEQLE